ncbi:hypothetical protein KJZ61_00115 [Candidatus Dependentiae bacterium]|nr:hypothetical protein [Candidatus Dependentiae bacterium]
MRIALLNLMIAFAVTSALLAQENDEIFSTENALSDDTQAMPLTAEEPSESDVASSLATPLQESIQNAVEPVAEEQKSASAITEFPVEPQEAIQGPTLPIQEKGPGANASSIPQSVVQPEIQGEPIAEITPVKPATNLDELQESVVTLTPTPQHQELAVPQMTAIPPIPAAPEPTTSKPVEAEKLPDVSFENVDPATTIGFDTLGLEKPSGNWLFKRIWWEKAEGRYEKIKGLVDQVMDLRMQFLAKRSEVDNKILDPFYIEQSINQGQLEEVVSFLINELKRERERDKSLSPQERQLYETLVAEKRSLEQLRLDVESIRTIDIALDDALTALMQQVNLCRSYENKSWDLFKDIAKVLDHEQARTLYYNMNTYLDNIKNIHSYLKNAFSQHFDGLITSIQQNITRIKTTMSALQEKGVNLRQQMITISDQEAALEKQSTPTAPQQVKDQEEDDEEEPKGFISLTWSYVTGFFKGIWDLLTFWRY